MCIRDSKRTGPLYGLIAGVQSRLDPCPQRTNERTTHLARLRWIGHTAAAGSLCGEWGCGSVVRIRGLMRMQHFRIRTSLIYGVSDPRQRAWICVCGSVRFRPEQICAVTDSVSEQQRSVRSISTTVSSNHSCIISITTNAIAP